MRVLISGGGIAGLTLAYWLHRYGISPVVIEQAAGLRRAGYALDFFGTGYDVAMRMGVIERLKAQQLPLSAITYVNHAGKPVATLTSALMRSIMDGKYLGLMHRTLEEALYEALADRVEVRFTSSLAAIESKDERVDVTFADGAQESFDLLVGADGVHSQTRELIFGPEQQFSHFLGYMVASYALPDHYGIGHTWHMYTEPGRLAGAYGSLQEEEIFTFFFYHLARPEHVAREQRLERLRQVFANMGWVTARLLADTPATTSIFLDSVCQIRMPVWYQGRVVLVGDACDCSTLVSGQGASLAMGGAYLLARALYETGDYREAFLHYEQEMRPYVLAQQKNAHGTAKALAPISRSGQFVQRLMLKLFLHEVFRPLLRRQFGAQSILPPPEA